MADLKQIQFKRSKTAGAKPTTAQIAEGELAINLKDRTIFTNDGSQIIDLGFAKGGQIDGNVTQVGNYTQTGNFTTSGDIAARSVTTTTGMIQSAADIRSMNGSLRSRAGASSNSHIWFEGEEMTRINNERGVMYASPQTADGGAIRLRVQNGTDATAGQVLFVWNGAGDFQAPRDLYGQRSRLSIETIAPTTNTDRLYTRNRTWNEFGTNQSYGWDDTVNYSIGDNGAIALNYVYKGRAHVTGTIWHQLLDERAAPEWALYTGSGPANKMFSIRSVGTLGHTQITGSLFIGGGSEALGYTSGMGEGSLALGDNDTGFRNDGDGMFSVMANSRPLVHYNSSAAKFQIEHRKATRITHTDNVNTTILPANNTALLEIDTSLDGNNAGGNGLTLLGYNSSGKYYHYFRGSGYVSYDMNEGVNINKGGLQVNGTATFNNGSVTAGVVNFNDYALRGASNRHIRFEYLKSDGSVAVDAYIYKDGVDNPTRRAGLRINCGTPNKTSGNTSGSGDFIFGEDGQFILPGGGVINQDGMNAGVYCMTALSNLASGSKNYLRRFRGGASNTIWHETVQSSVYTISTGNTDAQAEMELLAGTRATFKGEVVSQNANGLRIAYGTTGFFIRNDGNNTYFMLTNADDQYGSYNGLRPLYINNSNGGVVIGHAASINGTLTVGGISSFNNKLKAAAGLGVGVDSGFDSSAIAIGDSDTGFVQEGDGVLNAYTNSQRIMRWTTGATAVYKQLQVQGINGPALLLNATASNQSVYVYLQRAGTNAGYIGFGGAGNEMTMHNYILNTNLQLRTSDVYINRGLYSEGDGNFNNVYIRSDITLKRNFKQIENALDKVEKLDGLIYEKKNSPTSTEYESVEAGIIAQSLQEVLPEAVVEKEGVLNVSASGTIALLVNAIKELKARVEYLESK